MGKIGLAFRAFFKILASRQVAEEVEVLFRDGSLPKSDTPALQPPAAPAQKAPKTPTRSDALTLLATLQREARFLDLVQEPLTAYGDAQVGAAARDVLRNCHAVLERLFAIQPVESQDEGTPIDVPAGFSAGKYRLTGNVYGQPPFHGTLQHRGWQATQCQLPEWTGDASTAMILAPAEVELK
jgi:hypothetical protein